jgi:hypothetical protein
MLAFCAPIGQISCQPDWASAKSAPAEQCVYSCTTRKKQAGDSSLLNVVLHD